MSGTPISLFPEPQFFEINCLYMGVWMFNKNLLHLLLYNHAVSLFYLLLGVRLILRNLGDFMLGKL